MPTARPLPTVPPDATFPAANPRPLYTAVPQAAAKPSAGPKSATAPPSAAATGAPLPSAFAQANTFVYGSPPPNTYAGPGDAPQIFYVTLTPTVWTPNATVRINAITTTQRAALGDLVGNEHDHALVGRRRAVARRVLRQRHEPAAGRDVDAPAAHRVAQRRSKREHSDHGLDPAELAGERPAALSGGYSAERREGADGSPARSRHASRRPPRARSRTCRCRAAARPWRRACAVWSPGRFPQLVVHQAVPANPDHVERGHGIFHPKLLQRVVLREREQHPLAGRHRPHPMRPCSRRASVSATASRSVVFGACTTSALQNVFPSGTL